MKKIRLNLDITPKVKQRIETVMERTESPSITETVRRSMAAYDMVTEHQAEGGKIVFRKSDGSEEVVNFV